MIQLRLDLSLAERSIVDTLLQQSGQLLDLRQHLGRHGSQQSCALRPTWLDSCRLFSDAVGPEA
jgi:hypothetical protein